MFDERRNSGIIFVGSYVPGQPFKSRVKGGDSFVLHLNEQQVLVRNITNLGDSRFKGVIYGFEPSFALEYQGIMVDQEVEFEKICIIPCSE